MGTFFDDAWPQAVSFRSFLESAKTKGELWLTKAETARFPEQERERALALPFERRVLVLCEHWCPDAIRSVPVMAALAEATPKIELRVLDSGEHPECLSGRLTRGARAIPLAVCFDETGHEIGFWGPRPAPLQALLRAKIRREGSPSKEEQAAFYAPIMEWYEGDGGRVIAEELLLLLERDSPASV